MNGSFIHKQAGNIYPFYYREINHKNFVFQISLNNSKVRAIYVRIEAGGVMHFPMSLWTSTGFVENNYFTLFMWGLYYGSMVAMILYNLFLFFTTRNKNYIYYVLTIFLIMIFQFTDSSLAYQYLWPNSPAWNTHSSVFGSTTHFQPKFKNIFY